MSPQASTGRDQLIAQLLDSEIAGGVVETNDPGDPGGLTRYGLTKDFLEQVTGHPWTAADIHALTRADAEGVTGLWLQQTGLDGAILPDRSDVLAFELIQWEWNGAAGDVTGLVALQTLLGLPAAQRADHCGPATLAALAQVTDRGALAYALGKAHDRAYAGLVARGYQKVMAKVESELEGSAIEPDRAENIKAAVRNQPARYIVGWLTP